MGSFGKLFFDILAALYCKKKSETNRVFSLRIPRSFIFGGGLPVEETQKDKERQRKKLNERQTERDKERQREHREKKRDN